MQTVLIVIHLMIVLALVGVVLLQRSEGGGLGIGGGSGFMTARGAANALTRATAILAAAFFATSLILSIFARYGGKPTDFLDRAPITQQTGGKGVLDQLPGNTTPAAPAGSTAPTPPSGDAAKPQSTQPAAPANGAATPAANGATAPATQQPAQPQVPNQ
ncbi:MAG: preprotein translocase subunit SecG [Aquamicrobium sp.]|jgi:preprotein translocase subunit SecG|uniref:preprotein translocase subunit SecG n=1 Tax=Mesorhizobium sp. Pch-S TaxID=2082387 RepID=UPI00101161DC|nr:preprotein translocase subunit SecG [Mesorhizobium sp. Pch-S]MBR2688209.1 preprotein translocase subunit SecG [Aquamicrobium sp.]QAZ46049.1 preprotein translocase subunit SecG [Mesorhizobium sp. Pch-S]